MDLAAMLAMLPILLLMKLATCLRLLMTKQLLMNKETQHLKPMPEDISCPIRTNTQLWRKLSRKNFSVINEVDYFIV